MRVILLLFTVFYLIFAQADTDTLVTQRTLFLQAHLALEQHQQAQFQQLRDKLQNYILYPYLVYWELLQNIDQVSEQQITDFQQTYSDTPLTLRLREVWTEQHIPHPPTRATSRSPLQVNTPEQQLVIQAIDLARKHDPQAAIALANIPATLTNHTVREWRVRTAIFQQNWPAVNRTIAQLTPEERATSCWQYWHAYALARENNNNAAQIIYQQLSEQVDYYGLLASEQLHQPYQPKNVIYPVNAEDLAQLENLTTIQRAHELYILNFLPDARREWDWKINSLNKTQLRAAAYLAAQWQWHDRAIIAAAKAGDKNALALRFPLAYARSITIAAKQFSLDPAWIFAIMRQESGCMPDAKSAAGALGLMQVLPKTAKTSLLPPILLRGEPINTGSLLDVNTNILLGSAYLKQLLGWFHNNITMATAAYNIGPTAIQKYLPAYSRLGSAAWIETLPWRETRDYVKSVLLARAIYQQK